MSDAGYNTGQRAPRSTLHVELKGEAVVERAGTESRDPAAI